MIGTVDRAKFEGWTDDAIIDAVKAWDIVLYELLMRRYIQRLYRVTRAILHNDEEVEDVIQEAYVSAYQHMDQFVGDAPFSAWLTRIAVNESIRHLHLRGRNPQFQESERDEEGLMTMVETSPDPEQRASIANSANSWKQQCWTSRTSTAPLLCCGIL
jgi:RNA polymerase sigma-70 factor (ECF subfamily)